MKNKAKKIAALAFWAFGEAHAANWFEVQTIALPEWGKGKLIGFIQPSYTDMQAGPAINGHIPKADLIQPTFDQSTNVAIQRARLFVRGRVNPDISYYVGTEAGQNGYAYSYGTYSPRLMDANMTFSHYIPGVRLEFGIIRAPGPEGAMQGFMDFSFFDLFPVGIAQLMQPNFYTSNMTYKPSATPANGGYLIPGANVSGNNAFRYPGVQAMDWFRINPNVELAYGVMLGENGRMDDRNTWNGPIAAGRVQMSYLFHDGSGRFFRDDLTGFAWYQQARPQLNGITNTMTRDGFGATYREDYMRPWGRNLKAEYIRGTGDIEVPGAFVSGPGLTPAQYETTFYPGSNNTANGFDATAGLFVTSNIELNARYDYYDRLPNLPSIERLFKTTGVGVTYHFTPLTRVVVNYLSRKVEIPNPGAIGKPGSPALNLANSVVDQIGDEFNIFAVYAF